MHVSVQRATSQPDLRFDRTMTRGHPHKKHSVQSAFEPIPEDGLMKQHGRAARSTTDLRFDKGQTFHVVESSVFHPFNHTFFWCSKSRIENT